MRDVQHRSTEVGNLTQFEYLAVNSSLNVADGHARQPLTAGQSRIIDDLPNVFAKAAVRPVDELEQAVHSALTRGPGRQVMLEVWDALRQRDVFALPCLSAGGQ